MALIREETKPKVPRRRSPRVPISRSKAVKSTKRRITYNVQDVQTVGSQPGNFVLSLPWALRRSLTPEASQALRSTPFSKTTTSIPVINQALFNLGLDVRGGQGNTAGMFRPPSIAQGWLGDKTGSVWVNPAESNYTAGHEATHALGFGTGSFDAPASIFNQTDTNLIQANYGAPLSAGTGNRTFGREGLPVLLNQVAQGNPQMLSQPQQNFLSRMGIVAPSSPMHTRDQIYNIGWNLMGFGQSLPPVNK